MTAKPRSPVIYYDAGEHKLVIDAVLTTGKDIEWLIRVLQANKVVFEDAPQVHAQADSPSLQGTDARDPQPA